MWKAVKYIILFFVIQIFVSVLTLILGKDKETSLLIGLLLSDILFITYILLNRETRPRPASFTLKNTVAGWQQGLAGQKVGSQVLLVIPPSLGYGNQEQNKIPANSTLFFVVDILDAY